MIFIVLSTNEKNWHSKLYKFLRLILLDRGRTRTGSCQKVIGYLKILMFSGENMRKAKCVSQPVFMIFFTTVNMEIKILEIVSSTPASPYPE